MQQSCTPSLLCTITRRDVNTAQTGWPDLVEALAMDGVTPAQRRNLLVYLMNAELGGPQLLSRGPFDEARALANRYKLARGSLGASTFTRRWDFENAREVVD